MNAKQFARLQARDSYCLHCGETEAVSPNHRINRGMGGSKLLDKASNLVILCSAMNNAIESDSRLRSLAIEYGWKLASWDTSEERPVYDAMSGVWYLLDNDFGRKVLTLPN